ncbi:class I SAM-dependent methyltransferase [Qipengyuania sp. 6B39]|uniref:class I SAM-dependent methyltransferase n=1 Tax=Qipengyuania proteolytica TaxID=2867239 RepID=UPI001C8AFA24|nr:class I SAM-dependent methyltransferase [Qipengyuania proteolytica]MBX7495824.1 class I SAM-dependent methyltransferase [Qipengyuania proteolytica]
MERTGSLSAECSGWHDDAPVSAADIDDLREALQCPVTKQPLKFDGVSIVAAGLGDAATEHPVANGKPVLIDFENSVISRERVVDTAAASVIERPRYSVAQRALKALVSPEKKATVRNIEHFIRRLKRDCDNPRVLVIGGGSVGQGMQSLYNDGGISLTAFDIYASPLCQFVADAHDIPIKEDYFDGVVVQAVLEHVLDPQRVVDEIWRVLKPGGLVYAETPFMQQVHEGAYDFTRFTESGHRYLFRRFELVDSGASAGPGRQLMWAVDYFVRSVFRSRLAGKMAKLAFFWAQYLDRVIPADHAVDGASGVYFLGTKSDRTMTPGEIVAHYKGAQ